MDLSFPDVTGLDVFDAACEYAANGIAVAPFDPSKGKGKSCWNLVDYRDITTSRSQLVRWRNSYGPFKALATSPGQYGAIVIDVDRPRSTPRHLRKPLATGVYVNTRPEESPNRGHYWFELPEVVRLGNPTLPFGEVRCVGGGIVMPPYGDRRIVRSGPLPALPEALTTYLGTQGSQAGAGEPVQHSGITFGQFCRKYAGNERPHKLQALLKLHQVILDRGTSPHDAMRQVLLTGLGEARIGYVPAKKVVHALRDTWDRDRAEFTRLVQWTINAVEASDAEKLKLKSDRCPGTDSREYA
ncbi:bifunctional DNA primase/polymerase [Mycolicibacterium psychrotolerans]|uniref:bifunctional DNA primase/polymerase n=1 Tax=Mycolicibacterium psychrotolerans TaxID=216929 RepID=UPI003D678F6F